MNDVWVVLIGTGCSVALAPIVLLVLRSVRLYDEPNQRSLHSSAIPRGGGVSVALAAVFAAWLGGAAGRPSLGVTVGAVILGLVGLADDIRSIGAAARLTLQFAIPGLVMVLLVDGSTRSDALSVVIGVIGVLWCASFVNAFNFMDGVNGISGMHAVVCGVTLAVLLDGDSAEPLAWAIAGAAAGFLPYNAVRPRMFLGDVGSYFVGFWLAGLAVVAVSSGVPPEVTIAPFLFYLVDTGTTIIRRARRRQRLSDAHRDHAYQRLVLSGWSHQRVAVSSASLSAVGSLLLVSARDSQPLFRVSLALVIVAVMVAATYLVPRHALVADRCES
jgi:UDP-N-acetylmuramyl pentapeptide phosphotransferase/UDP-N-acetylglucosamine-1-phosphate transferase